MTQEETDIFTPEKRHEVMSRVKCKNSKAELAVRSGLHRLGFRFRLHARHLPGIPDIVLPRYRTVILVHGCFWHQHPGCRNATLPKKNGDFWAAKLARNQCRDEEVERDLAMLSWKVIKIWECEVERDLDGALERTVDQLHRA